MKAIATICAVAMVMPSLLANTIDDKQARYDVLAAGEYHMRFLDAINAGKLDVPDDSIPPAIKNDARARMYFQAGFLRGVRSYSTVTGLHNSEGGGIHENFHRGVFYWELEGFLKGCDRAYEFGKKIRHEIDEPMSRELQKDNFNPEVALDVAIKVLERIDVERNQAEQPDPAQPATKPADEDPLKDQPSTLPASFLGNMKSWVYLHQVDSIFISSNISDEVFEVDFQFGKRDGRRFLSSLTLFYNSKYYSMDLSVLPELPWASTMIFKTESGVAFVLNAGGGEHVNYCVFEIELKTMDLVRSSWSHLNLGQVGKTTRMHLVEKKEP